MPSCPSRSASSWNDMRLDLHSPPRRREAPRTPRNQNRMLFSSRRSRRFSTSRRLGGAFAPLGSDRRQDLGAAAGEIDLDALVSAVHGGVLFPVGLIWI